MEAPPKYSPQNPRLCRNCGWASKEYHLESKGYYPPVGIYRQCKVELSAELRAQLPESFYRTPAMLIGHLIDNQHRYNDCGSTCPGWKPVE